MPDFIPPVPGQDDEMAEAIHIINSGPPIPGQSDNGSGGMSNPVHGNSAQGNQGAGFQVPPQYFQLAQSMFPDAPARNLQQYLPEVLRALVAYNLADPQMVLMALATIRVETGQFAPISEYQSKYNTAPGGAPYGLYDFRKDIGNNAVGDGARYCGRGFIQLTGKANYQKYSQSLGLGDQLIQQPDLANNAQIAARLLACFLKNHESTIRNALAHGDYATARKAVNGGSHGLDQFIACYQTGANLVGVA